MRIGMIGTGNIASQHLEALAGVAGVEIVGVAGRNHERAKALADAREANAYDDWQTLVARERPDAVYVCLVPVAAAEVAVAIAGKVKGVLVEKPVASVVTDAERAAKAFKGAGTIAGAAYQNRVRAVVPRVRELCATAPVIVAEAYWHGGMPPPLWWRTRAQSGGQMTEQCTHLVDLLRVWMGEAVEVTGVASGGTMSREHPDFDVDDAVSGTIRFASGAVASVHTSCVARPKQELGAGVGITLRARGWEAKLSGWGLDAHVRHEGGRDETFTAEGEIFRKQAEKFVTAVRAGDASQLPCPYADAVATLTLTAAIHEAARTGRAQRIKPT